MICMACDHKLMPKSPVVTTPAASIAPRLTTPKPGEIICTNPNCGHIGKPVKKARGNAWNLIVGLVLLPVALTFVLVMISLVVPSTIPGGQGLIGIITFSILAVICILLPYSYLYRKSGYSYLCCQCGQVVPKVTVDMRNRAK